MTIEHYKEILALQNKTNGLECCIGCGMTIEAFDEVEQQIRSDERRKINQLIEKKLLDQLYRFEGILGKYNCQHGGRTCDFQVNCHRLIREEIESLQPPQSDSTKSEK